MARQARRESIDPLEIQIIHTTQRCVRQAYLCGVNHVTGKSYEHRRQWIRDRLEFLASVFAIDCLTFAVLSNHLHLVLRSRPDVAQQWTGEEIARRWLRLCPLRRQSNGDPAEPTKAELNVILNDPARLNMLRIRLSDISWWMKCTSENIARRANKEEGITGHFWEGRFGGQMIIDDASLLGCAMYVDLNPIRAALADTPESSDFTGAKARIDDLKNQCNDTIMSLDRSESVETQENSGWMAPLEIDEFLDPSGPNPGNGRRASNKGFLPISLSQYLELLDWTGRAIRSDKRGAIPVKLAPILTRIGLDADRWCMLVSSFERLFKRVAGTAESVAAEAQRRGQSYFHAPGGSLFITSNT